MEHQQQFSRRLGCYSSTAFCVVIMQLSAAFAADTMTTDNKESAATVTQAGKGIWSHKNKKPNWQCKWCPYDSQTKKKMQGQAQLGIGTVSDDSNKHGNYTGLNEEGAFAVANISAQRRIGNSGYLDLSGDNLGLDSRQVRLLTGLPGTFALELIYDEIPTWLQESGQSPYSGDTVLDLPTAWTPNATTGTMADLQASLHDIDFMTKRRTFGFNASYQQSANLSYEWDFQRYTKKGRRVLGLALGDAFATTRAALLPVGVDQENNTARFKLSFNQSRWQSAFNVQFASFKNNNDRVTWENAFDAPGGVTQGQAALEPDNDMQQISAQGVYVLRENTVASASLALGRMRQNETYLPYTVNSALVPSTLPRTSLDGLVYTYDARMGLYSKINNKLNLEASYSQHEQDNETPRATYTYVAADTNISGDRSNLPYSFRQRLLQTRGGYRFDEQHKLSLGYEYDIKNRTFQEVSSSSEHRLWGSYKGKVYKNTDLSLRLEHQDRQGDQYQAVPEILPAENSLLRKYNLADRVRDKAYITITSVASKKLNMGLLAELSQDDYDNSSVGLQQSKEQTYSANLSYQINTAASFIADFSQTRIQSTQAGSLAASVADWYADNDERIDMTSMGLLFHLPNNRVNVGIDYGYAYSVGETHITNSADFPRLTSRRHSLNLYGDYELSERSSVNTQFRYEKYMEDDWGVDGVDADTIDNVLTMGERNPDYSIWVVALSLKYRF